MKKPICLLFAIIIALLLTQCGGSGGGGGDGGGTLTPQVSWYVDLVAATSATYSAVRHISGGDTDGQRYWITWAGADENPYVSQFDGTSWSSPKQVGSSPGTDFHYYPVMIRDSLGTLHVFYGAHNSTLRHSSSSAPNSAEGSWTDSEVSEADQATYPMPVVHGGAIYVFYRLSTTTVTERPLVYIKSNNNGVTWEPAREAINLDRTDNCNEVYAGQAKKIGNSVHFVWTAGGGPGHDVYHRDVFYTRFSLLNERFYDVLGNDLGPSVNGSEANQCVVVSTGNNADQTVDYQLQVSVNRYDQPVILWRHKPSGVDQLRVTNWNGTVWSTVALDSEYYINQDIEAVEDSEYGFRAYSSSGTNPRGVWILESTDNGNSWSSKQLLKTADSVPCSWWIPLNGVGNSSRVKAMWVGWTATDSDSTTTATRNVYAVGVY